MINKDFVFGKELYGKKKNVLQWKSHKVLPKNLKKRRKSDQCVQCDLEINPINPIYRWQGTELPLFPLLFSIPIINLSLLLRSRIWKKVLLYSCFWLIVCSVFLHLMQIPSVLHGNAKASTLIGPILCKVSFIKRKSRMQHYTVVISKSRRHFSTWY